MTRQRSLSGAPRAGRRSPAPGRRPLAALAALSLLWASGAQAAPFVDVTYDLDDSAAISVVDTGFGPLLETVSPPQVSGSMKIRYASDSGSGLVTGPSSLRTFNLSVQATVGLTYITVDGAVGTRVVNTGTLRFHLTSPVTGGTLLPGGTADPLGGIGQLQLTGTIVCFLLCDALDAPFSTPVPVLTTTFPQPLGPLYGTVDTPHTVTVTGTQYANFYFDVYSPSGQSVNIIATTFIVGREVLREPVPEPGTLPLLGLGAAGLGALALLRRSGARARR